MNQSKKIVASWQANAQQWIDTIEGNEIESRQLATNKAIVDAVLPLRASSVLDVGCGEGWLTRLLREKGVDAYGVDAIPQLIQAAIEKGGPYYFEGSYADIGEGRLQLPLLFDAAVINFALLDEQDTECLVSGLHRYLLPSSRLVIQTLHPFSLMSSGNYTTGWKEGSWQGMKREFVQPYHWYFRTLQSWMELFVRTGWQLQGIQEPLHPETGQPLSQIFILQLK